MQVPTSARELCKTVFIYEPHNKVVSTAYIAFIFALEQGK